jgi:serine protease
VTSRSGRNTHGLRAIGRRAVGLRAAGLRFTAAALATIAAVGTTGAPALATPPQAAPPLSARPVDFASPLTGPVTGDWVRNDQWYLKTLNIAGAWDFTHGEGVTVAVIDSGVDASHADLNGQVLPGLDLVGGTGDGRNDPVGHGTTVSAIIAGRNDDSSGIVGIAPKAKILPVRVLDQDNRYDDALIVAKAVRWSVDHGAKVINLSLGGNGSSAALAAALDYAFAKDVVVVACTGNTGTSGSPDVWYPAREPGVIAVAGLERNGETLWNGSITGKQTVVAAPSTQLLGAKPGGYWRVQGTSFAAPMVSGTAALIRSRWPDMPAAEVINRIIRTADDRGVPGKDDMFGYGEIDPTAALTADVPTVPRNPLDNAPPPGVARFGNAPAAGQTLASPQTGGGGPVNARASGANAGWAVDTDESDPGAGDDGWWAAAGFFLVSALAALLTIRRYSSLA